VLTVLSLDGQGLPDMDQHLITWPVVRVGLLALLTLNRWREARVWMVPHMDAIAHEVGLWWYRGFPHLGLSDLFLLLEAGLGADGRLPPHCHQLFLRLLAREHWETQGSAVDGAASPALHWSSEDP